MKKVLVIGTGSIAQKHIDILNSLNYSVYVYSETNEKFFKKNVDLINIKKNDIIYWKGHVAVALSNKKVIHAYGPKKKVVIMNIAYAIKLLKKTANLDVVSIKKI